MTTGKSLTLEGKDYKWWIPKEFLPQNEEDQNWTAWNKCMMEGLTLSQYASTYPEVILKLEGLDDFQKVLGFVRGLDKAIRLRLKSCNFRTLVCKQLQDLILTD